MSVRCDGLTRSFNAVAKVIRFNSDERFPKGYGMRFESIPSEVVAEINQLVGSQEIDTKQASRQAGQ